MQRFKKQVSSLNLATCKSENVWSSWGYPINTALVIIWLSINVIYYIRY